MKIEKYYLDVDDKLYVYIPVRFYELTLRHRLLDQLGGFSHLLLDALTLLPGQGIEWVLKTTGLSLQQLQPILNRLDGLNLMQQGQLTKNGKKLVDWKNQLHGQTRQAWLDGDYRNSSFCGDASLDVIELHEDAPFIIRNWHLKNSEQLKWPCNDWNEDCTRQKNRILRNPEKYLGSVFETFRDCFIESGFSVHEWNLDIRYISDKNEFCALKIQLDPNHLRPGSAHDFVIACPVLSLETCYRLPVGAPIELLDLKPEDHLRAVSFGCSVPDIEHLLENPTTPWSWPEVDETTRRQAVNLLFQKVAVAEVQAEAVFNREHRLLDHWQSFGFDWPTVEGHLQNIRGIHLIKGDT